MRRYGLVDIPTEASDVNAVPVSADSIISGGIVTWSGTGLVFNVSACNYYIDNVNYNSPDATLTLDPADATYDRIDVFAVDVNGDAIIITGTPSANPQEPQVDPSTQIKLTTVIVQAGATTPSGVANNMIYDENVELWSKSNSSLTVDYVNTTTPYVGTYCILATTTSASTFKALTFSKASIFSNKGDYDIFSFAIKLSQTLLNNESIKIIFSNTSLYPNIKVAEYAITSNNSLGLSFSNTSAYQLIGIPMNNINFTNNSFNFVQIQFVTSRTSISFRLDRILMQYGINQPTSPTDKNSFGNVVSQSGTASATMATDTLTIDGSGLATTSVSGKTLTIAVPDPIPSQTSNNGKYLTTDGSALSWDFPLNIYNGNGSLSSNRTLTSGTYSLTFSGAKTSGTSLFLQNSQTGTNASDLGDGTLSINYNINGSSGTELVVRAVSMGVDNNMTGGVVTNMRAWNLAYTTASGSTTSNLDMIYLESVSSAGTVTDVRGIRINILQGTNQAGLTFNALGGTNNAYAIFGQTSIPTGNWGIYQSESGYTNYFAGKLLIGTSIIGTENLTVVGSAIISSTVTLSDLAGTGDRMVVANSSGVLSTQAIPGGGGGSMAIGGSITSATAGSVLFAGTSGVLAQDNANFFWDDNNNRLGIGTSSPTQALDIRGQGIFTGNVTMNSTTGMFRGTKQTGILLEMNSFTNYGHIGGINGTTFYLGTGSVSGTTTLNALTWNTSGNVVINNRLDAKEINIDYNNSSFTRLLIKNLNNSTSSYAGFQLIADSASTQSLELWKFSPSYSNADYQNYTLISDRGNGLIFRAYNNSGRIDFRTGFTSDTIKMRLTNAGRLLIGTTTENTYILDVNGTTRFQQSITIAEGYNIILGTSTGTRIGTSSSQKLGFYNATPIIRPTTGVASATFVENSATTVNIDSTFDGYTIQQVVRALRNLGLLS